MDVDVNTMEQIVEWAKHVESLVSIGGNILLAILGIWASIRAKKWKATSKLMADHMAASELNQVMAKATPPLKKYAATLKKVEG